MIISHQRQYIFAHAPKTGGTSLALALEARAAKDDILIGDTPKALKRRRRVKKLEGSGRLWKHSRLSDIHGIVSEQQMKDYFVVTLIRNPWDRMVSYYHWLQQQGFDHPAVTAAKDLVFSQFLRDGPVQASFRAAPYESYVKDRHGLEHCNQFVRLEHLSEDLVGLEAHLGFSLTPLARTNVSQRGASYQGYFNPADVDVVAEFCAVDIERFGYVF